MEWYHVWWPWLISNRVARVCQHKLSFLLLSSDDDDCMKTVFRPLHNVVDSIFFSEFYIYACAWSCPCIMLLCVLFWLLFFLLCFYYLYFGSFSLLLFYLLSDLRRIKVFTFTTLQCQFSAWNRDVLWSTQCIFWPKQSYLSWTQLIVHTT